MTDSLLDQDQNKNYLEELVGEGKKFKTPEELAKGKYEADRFIEHKNREFDTLREDYLKLRAEYNTGQKLQELLDKYSAASSQEPITPQGSTDQKPLLDEDKLDSRIFQNLQKYEAQKKEQENESLVKSKLQERFGNDYQKALREQATNLGLTDADIISLARKSPTALFNTLGLNNKPADSFQAPPRSNVRSDSFAPSTSNKRTWSYYQNIKQTNPELYLSPKIQSQILQDASELGSAFEDGDFHKYS